MPTRSGVPTREELMNPIVVVLQKLGGSASIQEMIDELILEMKIPDSIVEIRHGKNAFSELEYQAAWARTYLKNYGLVENSEKGIWALTKTGLETKHVDPKKVAISIREKGRKGDSLVVEAPEQSETVGTPLPSWRHQLLEILQKMEPGAFERLCQRLLREAGFFEVEVTGRSGDGGIDGFGTIRIGGLISFNVLFQSKRYKGSIGADVVRDFRGAMVGRADKGLIITTGTFTREARKEATRDGAPPLDLIDGELLVEKLKDLRLGIKVELVESVLVNEEWFGNV